jgi:hypothetical protein
LSLFAETCIRCGNTLAKRSADALPTCDRCRTLVQTKLQADSEVLRRCPTDGAVMSKEVIHDLVIDRCPDCRGVWLDGGELVLLERAITGGDRDAVARTVVLGMTRR